MKNTLPQSNTNLITLALKACGALTTHQDAIGIMHNTESVVTGSLSLFTNSIDEFAIAKEKRSDSFIAQATAFSDAGVFLNITIDVLTPHLGRRFSPAWATAFGPRRSVPTTLAGRLECLRKVEKHLKANPTHEKPSVEEPDGRMTEPVTQARAKDLREALGGAISAVANSKSDVRAKKAGRTSAKKSLTRRLRGLFNELGQLIPETDSRWSAFGFNAPGETQAPEPVQGLQVSGIGPGKLGADWPDSPRAERYLLEVLVVGQDEAFRRIATVQDSDADFALPAGADVKVRVIAANEAGESTPSAVVETTVPLAA